jgi:hypothetical protein
MNTDELDHIHNLATNFEKTKSEHSFDQLYLYIEGCFRKEDSKANCTNYHKDEHNSFKWALSSFHHSYFVDNHKDESTLSEFCLYIKNWTILHKKFYDTFAVQYGSEVIL